MTSKATPVAKDPTETVLIRHNAFQTAYKAIAECYASYGLHAEPLCKVIAGPSGAGKSTLLLTYQKEHPVVENPYGDDITVLNVTVPPEATLRSFSEHFLTILKDPYPKRGSAAELGKRIDKALGRGEGGHSVRVIAIQEAQRLIDSQWIDMWDAANFIRERIEATGASFVLTGLSDTDKLVDCNEQLQRLFDPTVELNAFDWTIAEDRTKFRVFLKSLRIALSGSYELQDVDTPDLAFRLHYASYGLVGYLMKIIRGAADIARAQRTEVITRKFLEKSYLTKIRIKDARMCNPFTASEFSPDNAPHQLSPHEEAAERRASMKQTKKRAPVLSRSSHAGI
jgi:GTPase SAR1 family protein